MASAKSLQELHSLYSQMLTESTKPKQKQRVGGAMDIGKVNLTKEGGDEKTKKDTQKPTEKHSEDGKLIDADKEISGETVKEESKNMKPQSTFDKVFNQIFNEKDENLDTTIDTEVTGDDIPDIPGEVTEEINPAELINSILDSIEQLKTHLGLEDEDGEEEVEVDVDVSTDDLDGVDDVDGPVKESADGCLKKLPDSKGKSLQGAKKKSVVGKVKVVKKKASAAITTGNGKPQAAPKGEKQANIKNNKVNATGAVTGGNANAFE